MQLFERVKRVAKKCFGSDKGLAEALGIPQSTFSGWLNEKREDNLWPHLAKIVSLCQDVRREWLYFGEGEMLAGDAPQKERRPRRVTSELPYPDDALGRIAQLVNVRTSSALELQSVFGVDFKEIQKFLSRYEKARAAREAWEKAGGDEASMPTAPEPIPDAWLHYFWTHFGPNPGWIQRGEREYGNTPLLREWPRNAELERLNADLLTARRECAELREKLAAVEQDRKTGPGKPAMPGNAPTPPAVTDGAKGKH